MFVVSVSAVVTIIITAMTGATIVAATGIAPGTIKVRHATGPGADVSSRPGAGDRMRK